MKVLVAGLMKFCDRIAILKECSDGRHLVRIEPLYGGEKPYCEWLCGEDYLEWFWCLRSAALRDVASCR